ncbi:cell division protein ZapE [Pseudomonadota bacterium]
MTPSQKYQSLLSQSGFEQDPAQQQSIALLDRLYEQLLLQPASGGWRSWLSRSSQSQAIRGLYFWGGVGRGKTLLMDLFYQSLTSAINCERVHFHRFMNQIHASLRAKNNLENPLRAIARDIAARVKVLCLDEFVIIDIGDAMIMAGLLETLFAEGVVLVTTSNAAPRNLYRDGLQRARFVPAIDLLEQHCLVVELDGGQDYRLRFLQQTGLYAVPHDDASETRIRDYIEQHVAPLQSEQSELRVNGRSLAHHFCAGDTVWFSFSELCETTRSQNDYLELARFFNTIIVTDIRQMDSTQDDVARRFVLLIDVLYDHHVKLICSAEVRPDQLYLGSRLSFEFERTTSRLLEMQSAEYLAQAHSQQ